jgi:hypothetical protein
MVVPMIHRWLRRDDLWRLVAQISRTNATAAKPAAQALEAGEVDHVLDSPEALEAVLGNGGPPAPLPLTLLWYVPIRATLRSWGVADIDLADFTATLPILFSTTGASRRIARGERGVVAWANSIDSMPPKTLGRAERAAECGALALWWAGCFPSAVTRQGGRGSIRAYVSFAATALMLAGKMIGGRSPETAAFYRRVADHAGHVRAALNEARRDYLDPNGTSPDGRVGRFLDRITNDPDGFLSAA